MSAVLSKAIQINDEVTVGPQPSEEEIQQLADDRFRAVVNFRAEGEEEQPFSPRHEGLKVQAAGMDYLNIPVTVDSLGADVVDRFRRQFDNLAKPVYAHCRSGKRAAAMIMMHLAREQGLSGEQALKKAEELGLEYDSPELAEFIRTYVDDHGAER